MVQSKDIVRKIVERDGRVLVSFQNHAAYYTLPAEFRAIAASSQQEGREVSFSFDKDLLIQSLA
ncbi:MAG: hypothetical protein JNM12_14480 [Alphaproteobacteria bacterium]|nr:hypothetical protein [Alphaproteobacteria bacterium]